MRLQSLFFLFAVVTGTSFTASADGLEPISVVVAEAPSTATNFNVAVTISNNGDLPVIVSRAHLPFDWGGTLPNDQFYIRTYYNDNVVYAGNYAQVDQSDPAAYVTLQPHQSLSGIVDLHDSYKFFGVVTENNIFKVSFILNMGDVPEADAPDPSSPDYASNPNRARKIVSNEIITHFSSTVSPAADTSAHRQPLTLDANRSLGFSTLLVTPPDGSSVNDPRGTCTSSQKVAIDQAISTGGDVAQKSYSLIRSMFPPNWLSPGDYG